MPRVHYHLSKYISHRTAGRAYMDALGSAGVELADDPEAADVLILHDDPLALEEVVRRYRGRKRLIAYSVWEADILPVQYRRSLMGVDRVWTCTPFSARAFEGAAFAPVDVVPHVVDLPEPAPGDLDRVKDLIGHEQGVFHFYAVVDSVNPRKNLKGLLRAFGAAFGGSDRARLVVKQYRHPWDLGSLDNVVSLEEHLSAGEMAALHRVCDACVSAHHAEAWGLSLSDAMAAGNPVIATGYSGNMFYMDESNSLPAKFTLAPVSEEMCSLVPLFTPEMAWADVDERHLSYLMRKTASGKGPDLSARAAEAVRPFGPVEIGALMRDLLARI